MRRPKRSYYWPNSEAFNAVLNPMWESNGWEDRTRALYRRALFACMESIPEKKFKAILEECKKRDAEDIAKDPKLGELLRQQTATPQPEPVRDEPICDPIADQRMDAADVELVKSRGSL